MSNDGEVRFGEGKIWFDEEDGIVIAAWEPGSRVVLEDAETSIAATRGVKSCRLP